MKKHNCTQPLLGTVNEKIHALFPVPAGYSMILVHICSQPLLGTVNEKIYEVPSRDWVQNHEVPSRNRVQNTF